MANCDLIDYPPTANKIYVDKVYSVKGSFYDIATKVNTTQTQAIDFSQSHLSAASINRWIEDNTENKIKNVI